LSTTGATARLLEVEAEAETYEVSEDWCSIVIWCMLTNLETHGS
jgi:hypothetical protein